MPDAVTHPTPKELTAFGLGKLPERAAAAVAAHLESCPACRQAVAAVPPDSFLGKVRATGPAGSSCPPGMAQPGNAPSSADRPAIPAVTCPDVPPELARHPKFQVLRELGRGGMGVVYQARQTVMNRQVVIKVINRALLDQPGALERFRREVQAAAQLSHPNIVTAYDAEQAGDLHMLVMEFVPGQSLAEVVQKKGPLPVAHACHCMRQAALGLQHAFGQGMVHRDIKPQNLMLTPKGRVKILDFGLAKVVSENQPKTALTAMNAYMGTPDYSAPEQATDARSADIRADLYSLGCTLYCLLAGRPPFHEETAVQTILAHLEKQPQPLPQLRPDVPERLWEVVARLLAKEPAQRYQKPIEVVQALAPFVKPGATPDAKSGSPLAPAAPSPVMGTRIDVDTSHIKKVVQDLPGQAPPREVPAKDEASPFANLVDTCAAPSKTKGARESTGRVPAGGYRRRLVLAGLGVLLLALFGMWAGGVFKLTTKDGTIVLYNLPPDAEVSVDGQRVTVRSADGITFEVRTDPVKKHRLEVKKDGFKVFGREVEIEAGGRKPILVSLEPREQPPAEPRPSDGKGKDGERQELPAGPPEAGQSSDRANPMLARKTFGDTIFRRGNARIAGNGSWRIDGEDLVQGSIEKGEQRPSVIFGDRDWSSYDLTLRAKWERGRSGPEIWFHYTGPGDFCGFTVGGQYNTAHELITISGGRYGRGPKNDWIQNERISQGKWYDVRIEVREDRFRCFLDRALIFQVQDERFKKGRIGLAGWEGAGRFRDIKVTAPDGTLLWNGLPDLPEPGQPATTGQDPPRQNAKAAVAAGSTSATDGAVGRDDAFGPGSVWKGEGNRRASDAPGAVGKFPVVLRVIERGGTAFKARMELLAAGPYKQVREVQGTIENGKITWSAKNVKVIEGHAGHDHVGEVSGNRIELRYKGPAANSPDVQVEGEVNLSLVQSAIPPNGENRETAGPAPAAPDPIMSKLEKAKAGYDAEANRLRKWLLERLDDEEKKAKRTHDNNTVGQIKTERLALEKKGKLPKSVSITAYQSYVKHVSEAHADLVRAYESAVKGYKSAKPPMPAAAKAVEEECARFERESPADPLQNLFQKGEVWGGPRTTLDPRARGQERTYKLVVTGRTENRLTGSFYINDFHEEWWTLEGTIKHGVISFQERGNGKYLQQITGRLYEGKMIYEFAGIAADGGERYGKGEMSKE
jgi:serine/threonine protein kinase